MLSFPGTAHWPGAAKNQCAGLALQFAGQPLQGCRQLAHFRNQETRLRQGLAGELRDIGAAAVDAWNPSDAPARAISLVISRSARTLAVVCIQQFRQPFIQSSCRRRRSDRARRRL